MSGSARRPGGLIGSHGLSNSSHGVGGGGLPGLLPSKACLVVWGGGGGPRSPIKIMKEQETVPTVHVCKYLLLVFMYMYVSVGTDKI